MSKLRDFRLLADENIHPVVVRFFKQEGFDVRDVRAEGGAGMADRTLMQQAFEEERVVVTHDRDFGRLVFAQRVPFTGVLYLWPGHIDPAFTTATVQAVLEADLSLEPPFLLVAEQTAGEVKMRLRHSGKA